MNLMIHFVTAPFFLKSGFFEYIIILKNEKRRMVHSELLPGIFL